MKQIQNIQKSWYEKSLGSHMEFASLRLPPQKNEDFRIKNTTSYGIKPVLTCFADRQRVWSRCGSESDIIFWSRSVSRIRKTSSSFLPVLTAFSPSQHMATTGPWSIYFTNPLKKGLTNRKQVSCEFLTDHMQCCGSASFDTDPDPTFLSIRNRILPQVLHMLDSDIYLQHCLPTL